MATATKPRPKKAKPEPKPEPNLAAVEKIKNPHTCWKGTIQFGLIPVPVKFHTGARADESISFNSLHDCGDGVFTKLRQQMHCEHCNIVTNRVDGVVKGYAVNEGQYIIVTGEELAECKLDTAEVITIEKFVALDSIDPSLFEASYFIGPDRGGERGWNLIRVALVQGGYAALAKVSMHSREHLIIIRPYRDGLMAHTMFYAGEVKQMTFPQLADPKQEEVELALQLIKAATGEFNHLDYTDGYDVAVKTMLAEKQAGVAPSKRVKPLKPHVDGEDLMAALKASLAVKKGKAA